MKVTALTDRPSTRHELARWYCSLSTYLLSAHRSAVAEDHSMIDAGTADARCGRIVSRRRWIRWPRSLMGRIAIVLMTMVLWVVFMFFWTRQTALSIWWH